MHEQVNLDSNQGSFEFFSRIATVLCNNTEGLFVNTGQP